MDKNQVLIWMDPFDVDQDKFQECLVKGVGVNVSAGKITKQAFFNQLYGIFTIVRRII